MAYTAAAYIPGKGTTITFGADTIANARVINMPEQAGTAYSFVHLGGVSSGATTVTDYGTISFELPATQATFTAEPTIGTSGNITVTDSAGTAIINAKAATCVSISAGQISSDGAMVKVYTFKFSVAPYA
jgi:hypothetical protein